MDFLETDLSLEASLSGITGSVLLPPGAAFVGFNDVIDNFYSPPPSAASAPQGFVNTVDADASKSQLLADFPSVDFFGGGSGDSLITQEDSFNYVPTHGLSPPVWLSERADPRTLEEFVADAGFDSTNEMADIIDTVFELTSSSDGGQSEVKVDGNPSFIFEQLREECERMSPSTQSVPATGPLTGGEAIVLVCTPVALPANSHFPAGTIAYKLAREMPPAPPVVPAAPVVSNDHPAPARRSRKGPKASTDRRERKKEQNRVAAYRYRLKRKQEMDGLGMELEVVEARNAALRRTVEERQREISYLRGMFEELLKMRAKNTGAKE